MTEDIDRATNAKKASPFLNTDQAAFYIGLSRRTLEKMRCEKVGPPFRRHGRYIRYHIDELEAWSRGTKDTPTQTGRNPGETA
jgi:hypothetical protein